jgi:hypothetical protein
LKKRQPKAEKKKSKKKSKKLSKSCQKVVKKCQKEVKNLSTISKHPVKKLSKIGSKALFFQNPRKMLLFVTTMRKNIVNIGQKCLKCLNHGKT